jgi:hypothetical protein
MHGPCKNRLNLWQILQRDTELVLRPDEYFVLIRLSPMRQLGVIAVPSANPKLTHQAELPQITPSPH